MLELQNIRKDFNIGTVDQVTLFDSFSFQVETGSFVSVIGSNGSGKTTLLNLVCGSVTADSGSIVFDGKNITNMPEYKRASFIGRVYQNPQMGTCPELTIIENMALADNKGKRFGLTPAVNRQRVQYYKDLVKQCGMGLENRMNVKVGALSGGQRQRVAIARAMLKDAPIVILDEATSALDNKSEEIVQRALDNLIQNRTVFVIAHRLSTIKNADRIAVINEGELVELGTHDQLINIPNGNYKHLYEMQFAHQEEAALE